MRQRHTLKKELTVFMSLASVVTLMLVVLAVCYVFFSFFFENTQEDIEYVLNNTTQQYQSHMQFIEDGAIVGNGTHSELMKNCPLYQEIAYSQLSKEELEKEEV